jgi:hypothetical protein
MRLFTRDYGNITIEHTDKIDYLGIELNNKFDFDSCAIEKFKKVAKPFTH